MVKISRRTKTITVFGSSRPLPGDADYEIAYRLGRLLAESGYTVCNGGYGGTMEASAHGARDVNGTTIGVVTEQFSRNANRYIDRTIVMKSLVDRLMKLIELGDAYVVLKGSTGTLLELAAAWEFIHKRLMKEKPILLLGKHWANVIETLKQELIHEGSEDATRFVTIVNTPQECVEMLRIKLATVTGKQEA